MLEQFTENISAVIEECVKKLVREETIKKEIEQRDYQDMHRAISPLKKADDAIELDTSNMTLEEVVDQVLTLINKTREE